MVAFSWKNAVLITLAVLPSVVKAQVPADPVNVGVDVAAAVKVTKTDKGEVKIEIKDKVKDDDEYLEGSATASGNFVASPSTASDNSDRRLQTAPGIQFNYNALVTIDRTSSSHKMTVTFNVQTNAGDLAIPFSLTITSDGSLSQTTVLSGTPIVSSDDNEEMFITSAFLTTDSIVSNGKNKFTSYTFSVMVIYFQAPNFAGGWLLNRSPVAVFGEPHFRTWGGEVYDYQGQCELVLIRAPRVDLAVHIRTKIRSSYSFIESLALSLGQDVLEVTSYGEYFFNGVESAKLPATIGSSHPLRYNKPDKKHVFFTIDLDFGTQITIDTVKEIVNFKIENATALFEDSVGLMGTYGPGKHVARDGVTILKKANDFGQEWQVLATEPQLFESSTFEPQHPNPCILPDPVTVESSRRLLEATVSREAAEKACANAHEKENCVYDIMVTGDFDMALIYN